MKIIRILVLCFLLVIGCNNPISYQSQPQDPGKRNGSSVFECPDENHEYPQKFLQGENIHNNEEILMGIFHWKEIEIYSTNQEKYIVFR